MYCIYRRFRTVQQRFSTAIYAVYYVVSMRMELSIMAYRHLLHFNDKYTA